MKLKTKVLKPKVLKTNSKATNSKATRQTGKNSAQDKQSPAQIKYLLKGQVIRKELKDAKDMIQLSEQLSEQQLYTIGQILEKCVEGSKLITSNDSFQYAFRFTKIVDYSEKKFECSQAQAAKAFYEISSDRERVIDFMRQLKDILNKLELG